MKLEKVKFSHFDRSETYDLGFLRIHIPIITNENVITTILKKNIIGNLMKFGMQIFHFLIKLKIIVILTDII